MTNRHILLIEDNPDDEILTLRALRKHNIATEITVARDGVEALDYLFAADAQGGHVAASLPSLVLLDLKLPKVDGLEVLRRIRSDERTRLLPVVIFTSSNEEQDILECHNLGANSYIRKPVDFNQLSEALRLIGTYWLTMNLTPKPSNGPK
uniref:Response regulator n=1 Tax=Geobacter metallireducens TaxID=28232 RepID=A0A831TZJ2_GEOME